MKHLKTPQELKEASENLNISDVMNSILNDLQYELDSCRKPMGYQEAEYYARCEAKADAYEDAIDIVKKYCS